MSSINLRALLISLITLLSVSHATFTKQFYRDLQDRVQSCPPLKGKVPIHMTETANIDMNFLPFQILSVDEVSQVVRFAAVVVIVWYYRECAWNSTDFGGLYHMTLKLEDIWYPEILVPQSMKTGFLSMPEIAMIWSYGTVIVQLFQEHHTSCYMNFIDYPFDEHNCTISFVEYNGLSLQHFPTDHPFSLDYLKQHFGTSAEWILRDFGCESFQSQVNYTECWFVMTRRSIFYQATLIFPVAAMCVTTFLVFCIPAESGEKMSFLISLFVSMIVFINFIVDVIPSSMDHLPRLVWMILAVMLIIGMVIAVTTFILRRYHQEKEGKRKIKKTQKNKRNSLTLNNTTVGRKHIPDEPENFSKGTRAPSDDKIEKNDSTDPVSDDVQAYTNGGNAGFIKGSSQSQVENLNQRDLRNTEDQPKRKTWRNLYLLNYRQLDFICFMFFLFLALIITVSVFLF